MAANTSCTITLQARDWELLIGLIFNSADPIMQNLLFQLQTYYNGQVTKPSGTNTIAITSTELVVIKLATFLYGTTVQYVYDDAVAAPIARIMTALRALNNTADNYISTTLGAMDTSFIAQYQQIRKNGRGYIMILQYDGQ